MPGPELLSELSGGNILLWSKMGSVCWQQLKEIRAFPWYCLIPSKLNFLTLQALWIFLSSSGRKWWQFACLLFIESHCMPLGWHTHSCKHHGFMLTISLQNTLQFRKDPVICIWSFYLHFKIEAESKIIVKNNLIYMSSVFTADPVFQRYLSSWWEHRIWTPQMPSLFENTAFCITTVFLNKLHIQCCEAASRQVLLFSVQWITLLGLLTCPHWRPRKVHCPCLKHLHWVGCLPEWLVLDTALLWPNLFVLKKLLYLLLSSYCELETLLYIQSLLMPGSLTHLCFFLSYLYWYVEVNIYIFLLS